MKQKLFSRSDIEAQFGSLSTAEGKKKLADYALKNYGVKLVRNKSFENMMNDFENAVIATTEDARKQAGDAKEQIDLEERVDLSNAVELDPDTMDGDDIETSVNSTLVDEIVEMSEDSNQSEQHVPIVQDIEVKQLVEPGEIRSINDIPTEDQEKIREGLETGKLAISAELVPSEKPFTLSFPEGYAPKYRLVGPEGRAFINVPYWVYDWMQGRNWRMEIAECPYDKELLKSLAFYIERDGSVAIRESRNSKFIVIS